jgi:TetR/AcrR family transcriptional regulator
MVRPRADNYEERRQGILDGAAAAFAEKGFDGSSIATIAQSLGVSKALLYHYYHSKETLLYDMLRSHCELLVETARSAIKQADPPERQLQELVRALMRLYVSSRDKHVVLLNNLHCLPPAQQKEIKDLERQVLQIIKDLLAKLRPDLKASEKTSLAMYLMGAINWTYTWFKAPGPVTEKEFADLATATFLNGIYNKLPAGK